MLEMLEKMYILIKGSLVKEYGEQFTNMTKDEQAATVIKVMSDLVKMDANVAELLANKYVQEVA